MHQSIGPLCLVSSTSTKFKGQVPKFKLGDWPRGRLKGPVPLLLDLGFSEGGSESEVDLKGRYIVSLKLGAQSPRSYTGFLILVQSHIANYVRLECYQAKFIRFSNLNGVNRSRGRGGCNPV